MRADWKLDSLTMTFVGRDGFWMDEVMQEIIDMYKVYRRGQREPAEISSAIEAEGGQVLEQRRVSRLVPSPFHGLRAFPLLHEFRVRYPNREGHWYVRTGPVGQAMEWVWLDGEGRDTLPVSRDDAEIINELHVVGMAADAVIVLSMISAGVILCIAIYLAFF